MSKYLPLYDHLVSLKRNEWQTTFKGIETILGFKLPKSAYSYPAWWANNIDMHVQKRAWLNSGWITNELSLKNKSVTFIKNNNIKITTRNDNEKFHNYTWNKPEEINANIRIIWQPFGKLNLKDGKIVTPKLPKISGIYEFRFNLKNKISSYIGESSNLKRRMYNYYNPNESQKTNIRINKLIIDNLNLETEISVNIATEAWIDSKNITKRCDMDDKSIRRLIENLTITELNNNQYTLINK